MSCVVQKFGGTSVATLERIKNVADIIARTHKNGRSVVAVVSAMAGTTNKLVGYARSLNAYEGDPEYDSIVSSGELVTAGLLAMSLKNLGIKSRSYSAWQTPIFTDNNHGRAVIQNVDPSNLTRDMSDGIIPVVCGFQGVSSENRATTLGRGGSDLTATAVAFAVGAELCEIYSDVDGVYTVDPNLYSEAKRIDEINYQEMLEMSAQGAKILQEQSVDYAMKKGVVVRVASSFVDNGGTIISATASKKDFRGLAVTTSLSQIRVVCNADSSLRGAKRRSALEKEKTPDCRVGLCPPRNDAMDNNDLITSILEKNYIRTDVFKNGDPNKIEILTDKKKTAAALNLLKNCDFVKNARQIVARRPSSRISVIGSSVSKEVGQSLADLLAAEKIDVFGFSAMGCGINLIVSSDKLLEAVALLHKHCGLGK
ncbi:MAG: aspartate kinase [Holosporaceae bacterium]|nr:aspartate kinase [Holosporaceae bacterium]